MLFRCLKQQQQQNNNNNVLFICRILRPGAIWVNLGPLLYHYSDVSSEGSIEPTYEDLLSIIRGCGFQILVSINLLQVTLNVAVVPSQWR